MGRLLKSQVPGLGPYKLLQQLDEGGMGVVYLAEQTDPVERRVALKIIKPGMDTRQVIGRLEAERQALAMLDHPNIAKMLDAGTTGSSRPYFVMELVNGNATYVKGMNAAWRYAVVQDTLRHEAQALIQQEEGEAVDQDANLSTE